MKYWTYKNIYMLQDQILVLADYSSNISTKIIIKTRILSRLINLRISNDPPWMGGNIRHFVRINVSEIR